MWCSIYSPSPTPKWELGLLLLEDRVLWRCAAWELYLNLCNCKLVVSDHYCIGNVFKFILWNIGMILILKQDILKKKAAWKFQSQAKNTSPCENLVCQRIKDRDDPPNLNIRDLGINLHAAIKLEAGGLLWGKEVTPRLLPAWNRNLGKAGVPEKKDLANTAQGDSKEMWLQWLWVEEKEPQGCQVQTVLC